MFYSRMLEEDMNQGASADMDETSSEANIMVTETTSSGIST